MDTKESREHHAGILHPEPRDPPVGGEVGLEHALVDPLVNIHDHPKLPARGIYLGEDRKADEVVANVAVCTCVRIFH